MKWYIKALRNYANFDGRARRKEYWMYELFNAIISIILVVIDLILFERIVLGLIYSFAVLIPSIAVSVRRMHDTGRSGSWYFVNFVPTIGKFWFWFLALDEGEVGTNQYDYDPKAEERSIEL